MFTVMERSLRATGCDLPLYVIPYDDQRFQLPQNAFWLEEPHFYDWVRKNCSHTLMRKYLSLTLANYQYIDTDAIFLRNPEHTLEPYQGFVASCTEWNKPEWTVTPSAQAYYSQRWSTWQKEVFSTGQYACDQALYSIDELYKFAERSENRETCLDFAVHEQPGVNLLVLSTDVSRINLTLPPINMESSWAGDYDTFPSWKSDTSKPYLMHYAGNLLYQDKPVNELFFQFFTNAERSEWQAKTLAFHEKQKQLGRWPMGVRVLNKFVRLMSPRYHVQPR